MARPASQRPPSLPVLSAESDLVSAWACLLVGDRKLKRTRDRQHVSPSFSVFLTRSSGQRALCPSVLRVTV